MPKPSRIGTVNAACLARILPELETWGLAKHPNPAAYFGRCEFGYRYDFADIRDVNNVRQASFFVFDRDASISFTGLNGHPLLDEPERLYLLYGNTEGIYTLKPRFSLRHLLDQSFRLRPRPGESLESAADRLMDEIEGRLPLLKRYLYG